MRASRYVFQLQSFYRQQEVVAQLHKPFLHFSSLCRLKPEFDFISEITRKKESQKHLGGRLFAVHH